MKGVGGRALSDLDTSRTGQDSTKNTHSLFSAKSKKNCFQKKCSEAQLQGTQERLNYIPACMHDRCTKLIKGVWIRGIAEG